MAEAGVQPQVVRAVPQASDAAEVEAPRQEAQRQLRTPAWWVQRAGIGVAAAAVLVLALSISIQGFKQIGSKGGGATAGSVAGWGVTGPATGGEAELAGRRRMRSTAWITREAVKGFTR
jgi:hypothetical protein